jgi:hypothetical protein
MTFPEKEPMSVGVTIGSRSAGFRPCLAIDAGLAVGKTVWLISQLPEELPVCATS